MSFDLTILTKKVEGLKQAFESGRFGDVLVTALNTGNGLMQQRIFQDRIDVAGNSFGQYIGEKQTAGQANRATFRALFGTTSKTDKKRIKASAGLELTSYQRKRANKGRQVAFKDLEFTGGLRRAIETQVAEKETEKSATLQFSTNDIAKIAKGQEQQIHNIRGGGKGTTKGSGAIKIFTLNKSEREQVIDQGAELIKQIIKP